MISAQQLATSINNKCQQSSETAFLGDGEIITAINSAKNIVSLLCDWSWTYTYMEGVSSGPGLKQYTIDKESIKAYTIYGIKGQDSTKLERTFKPLHIGNHTEGSNKVYIDGKNVTSTEVYDSLIIDGHFIEDDILTLSDNINIPISMSTLMYLYGCGLIFAGGREQGADLSNKFFNDADKIAKIFERMYQFNTGVKGFTASK